MLPLAEPSLGKEELSNVIEAVKSGWISSKGKFIPKFEAKFAKYCGAKHGVSTSNGTVALHLALTALEIGPHDEVIVPTFTFIATANAVKYTGAKPVFVDSHPDYWCIDPEKIDTAITSRTKAIIPVHIYGHPCDMDAIKDIAKRHNLYIIEDAAEAHGAEYKGKKVGSFGDISCFSFYGNKIITTGEGGICLTNKKKLAERMKILRDHGMNPNKKYWHNIIGFNYRMTNMQAAVGLAQVEKINKFIDGKRKIAKWYGKSLQRLSETGLIKLHPEMLWAKCVYWMYSILVENIFGVNRDTLIDKLMENEIEASPLFYPIHIMPPYKSNDKFPIAEQLSEKGISLPSSTNLDQGKIKYISKVLES